MTLKIRLLLTATALFFSSTVLAHGDDNHSHETREQTAWHNIGQGALIIDARTAQEYAQGHIKGAINIPFNMAVEQFSVLEIRKDRKVVLYCRSGNRSGKALASLKKAGYSNLHNGGGYQAIMSAKE